jgi:hypothetical protein
MTPKINDKIHYTRRLIFNRYVVANLQLEVALDSMQNKFDNGRINSYLFSFLLR